MQSISKALLPVTLMASMLGAVAGYSFHARPAVPDVTCRIPTEEHQQHAAQGEAPAWMKQPALMDLSWKQWPSLTDF